jgi:hypothetical protein
MAVQMPFMWFSLRPLHREDTVSEFTDAIC